MGKRKARGLGNLSLVELLREAVAWNNQDLRGFEDITPDKGMLRARARVLRAALRLARDQKA